jgi:hypothetical protein
MTHGRGRGVYIVFPNKRRCKDWETACKGGIESGSDQCSLGRGTEYALPKQADTSVGSRSWDGVVSGVLSGRHKGRSEVTRRDGPQPGSAWMAE